MGENPVQVWGRSQPEEMLLVLGALGMEQRSA